MRTPPCTTLKRLKRCCFVSTVALGVATASARRSPTSTPAHAQEIQLTGPLAGRACRASTCASIARGASRSRRRRRSRSSTSTGARSSFGARLNYNIADWLAIGVWGASGALSSRPTSPIKSTRPRRATRRTAIRTSRPNDFGDQTAKMQWIAAPQISSFRSAASSPSSRRSSSTPTSMFTAAWPSSGSKSAETAAPAGQVTCTDPNSFALASRMAIAPTFGLGLKFYMTNFLSLGVEYRALPFSWNRAGFDSRGAGTNGDSRTSKSTARTDVQVQPDDHDFARLLASRRLRRSPSRRRLAIREALSLVARGGASALCLWLRRDSRRGRQPLRIRAVFVDRERVAVRTFAVRRAFIFRD